MEGTHTVLRLYEPIKEMCFVSLYSPARRSRGSSRDRALDVQPPCRHQRDLRGEDTSETKQRGQSYKSAAEILQSREATKGALAQLHWLAAEHVQLLTDVLSLCAGCADRLRMGNQDGKLEGYGEQLGWDVSSGHPSLSPEHKRAASRVRKLKKLASKRTDRVEDSLQNKMKKKMQTSEVPKDPKGPGTPVSVREADTGGSDVSVSSQPLLPMDEHFNAAHDGWDFMDEPQGFESEMDICSDLVEFDNQLCLGYEMENPVSVLQERNHAPETEDNCYTHQEFGGTTGVQLCDDDNRRDFMFTDNLKVKHTASLRSKDFKESFVPEHERNRPSTLTPSSPIDARSRTSNLRAWTKSPTSSSLSGVFNVSYPPSNSLRSMSPVLSPLSSRLPSPQMNHRIVLLPEEDDGNQRSSRDQSKTTTEVMDRNGNRRTITRLDLNVCRQDVNVNGASTSSATVSENSLSRPDEIWMLDGDDSISQEPLCRPNRPDHLDFLRITPPEDDIIGDTPYYPKLGVTMNVSPLNLSVLMLKSSCKSSSQEGRSDL
ncbi:hypothetical protein E1301_Tti022383 [Triplophysa tibetana]|uniref:Formin-1 n=1 Tax=Triplophysa tibetana TaxID=1572043 RepID=A0A5A9NRL0_9TELE|nr:hypothetical protein E1301_Tti022383 [Triplophysa tibetana]